jgi:hypothetical protein
LTSVAGSAAGKRAGKRIRAGWKQRMVRVAALPMRHPHLLSLPNCL